MSREGPAMTGAPVQVAPIQIGRKLENPGEILAIARHLGLAAPDPKDLHVTLVWSRAAVNWEEPVFAAQQNRIIISPQRLRIERFADGTLVVLRFECQALDRRHAALVAAGASWDWPDYRPHITLGPDPSSPLPEGVGLQGPIMLGPEYRKPAKT